MVFLIIRRKKNAKRCNEWRFYKKNTVLGAKKVKFCVLN